MMQFLQQAWVKRLISCLFGGLVLALMVGNQEGTTNGDFGIAFREAVLRPRVFVFLAIGLILFALITSWRLVVPYLRSPGMLPLLIGLICVIIAQTVMNWYDPIANQNPSARFSTVAGIVDKTPQLSGLTSDFFDWIGWLMLGLTVVAVLASVVRPALRMLGYLAPVLGVVGAVIAYLAHRKLVHVGNSLSLGPDHSLGVYLDVIGFLIMGLAGLSVVLSRGETVDTRGFVSRVLNWRPGFPLIVVAVILGLFAYLNDCWFAPLTRNADLGKTRTLFKGTDLSSVGTQYLSWLGWTIFAASVVVAVVATVLASKPVAWLSLLVAIAGIVLTFLTLHSMTFVAAAVSPNDGARWANLGAGGYSALLVFGLTGAASAQVLFVKAQKPIPVKDWARAMPVTAMVTKARESAQTKTLILVGLAVAIFYPPMLTVTWQNVIVTQIGVYVLLAIGLNVVVGWAGLLDLGYIAFYAIGSYTTAYVTGSLPRKPPSWLHMTPLAAIPFAIIACLIAGVLLGAPTLRLRGDYLAIVTLGFGEIITVVATNNPFNLTGGPIGPTVPAPRLHIGAWKITWGEDNLPFWYLLLVLIVIVLVLFYRLEGSRLGRAWAAIREDEIAAQASGINTTRVKLLAFAIGASTSGVAGVFFATQVGYFDPSLFTLQASILIVAYVVFGGMGSLAGSMAGAAVLTWLPQFLKAQVPPNDRPMWVGAAILAMMIFRPAGLIPAKRRKAELSGLDSPSSAETRAVPLAEGL